MFTVGTAEDEIVTTEGKQYKIPKDVPVQVFVTKLHKDTSVWGEDVSGLGFVFWERLLMIG